MELTRTVEKFNGIYLTWDTDLEEPYAGALLEAEIFVASEMESQGVQNTQQ